MHRRASAIDVFQAIADPTRRAILDLLSQGERGVSQLDEPFHISLSAVSQHLKVLRESGFAHVRPEGARRLYAVDAAPFRELDDWLEHFRRFWGQRLDSLATELARGKRARRLTTDPTGKKDDR